MNWQVKKLSPFLGAEVTGPDLGNFNEDDVAEVKKLLLKHKVLFFPGQHAYGSTELQRLNLFEPGCGDLRQRWRAGGFRSHPRAHRDGTARRAGPDLRLR